jgi:hypothetical protein
MNPVSRLLAAIVAVLAMAGFFFFGIFVLVLAVGLGLVAWLAIYLRMWWIRRRFSGVESGAAETARPGEVIDGEYTVVSKRHD